MTAAQKTRVTLAIMGFIMIAAALWLRLIWLQILDPDHWVTLARRQHIQVLELRPTRGAILDRNLRPLAVSLRLTSVFSDPRHVKNPSAAARFLAPLLKHPEAVLKSELSRKERGFVWLARRIPNQTAQKIRSKRLPGIHLMMEPKRFYPHGHLASHLVGFAGLDAQGLEGMELACDRLLRGEPGWRWMERDARQRPVGAWEMSAVRARDGLQLVLTLDTTLQFFAEQGLDAAWEKHHPKAASIVVTDPFSGEILALANRPSFDPNGFDRSRPEDRRNRAVTDSFEPGSVFKIVTAAVALGTQRIRPEDTFHCENGAYAVAGRVLHDHRPHGLLTFREVITQSSNIGVAKAAMVLGPSALYRGIRAFGFGDPTGVELPGEVGGTVKHPNQWSRPTITTVPMGHEVAVSALQLAQAFSVVANGGLLIRPRIVKEIRDPSGAVVERTRTQIVRRVVTAEVADRLKEFLVGVVEEGTGKLAAVPGFRVGGKTGTAQKTEAGGGYSHSRFVASFVGFAPAENPRLCIVVVVDEPRSVYYGGVVAAPVFSQVAANSLAYLGCRPALVTAKNEQGSS